MSGFTRRDDLHVRKSFSNREATLQYIYAINKDHAIQQGKRT